ncbi:hypothetical protein HUJ04_013107 [Dendroctonus ponderosae]|nr:hypothetical protein HUJ04_013107 [Dendroctonus ponderosae]
MDSTDSQITCAAPKWYLQVYLSGRLYLKFNLSPLSSQFYGVVVSSQVRAAPSAAATDRKYWGNISISGADCWRGEWR